MRTYELQSAVWAENGELLVAYRVKTFFAGSSQLICEQMNKIQFVLFFGKKALPPKSKT